MAALAGNVTREKQAKEVFTYQVVDAAEVYAGGYAAMLAPTHGTVASRGRVKPYDDADFHIPMGFFTTRETGDIAAATIPTGKIQQNGSIIKLTALAGTLAGTVADQGLPVYALSDNDFTVDRPASSGLPVGMILEFITGTTYRVLFFSAEAMRQGELAGGGIEYVHLGCISPNIGAPADLITGIEMQYHGRFLAFNLHTITDPTDADVDIDCQLEIDGVLVTGGVAKMKFDDTVSLKKTGTAITGLNEFHRGSLVDIPATVVTAAGTATENGLYNVYAVIEKLFGE